MITNEQRLALKQLLIKHEELKQFPYTDTTGHLTIGIGRNLTDRGISQQEAYFLLDDDINYFVSMLNEQLPWFNDLNANRQVALIDMCFNIGMKSFLEFEHMLYALKRGYYIVASEDMLNSEWAKQVGQRAIELAEIIKTGNLEVK